MFLKLFGFKFYLDWIKIKERFDGRLKHITEVTPKLSTLQILDETLHIVSVYGDFTVDIKGMLYHGTIELYEIGEWN